MTSKILTGTVTKVSSDNTCIYVVISNTMKHSLYHRIVKKTQSVVCHNNGLTVKIGSRVTISPSRPFSKSKFFNLLAVV